MTTQFKELEKNFGISWRKHGILLDYGGHLLVDEARFYCHDIAAGQCKTEIVKDFPDTIKCYFQYNLKQPLSDDKLNEILADIHKFSEENPHQIMQIHDKYRNGKCNGKTAGQASRGDWRF
jgi:hypothetical protein